MSDNLTWLQEFYLSFCNGDWEHSYGCTIENLDNPGWSLKFELTDTVFETINGLNVTRGTDTSEDGPDWIILKKEGSIATGFCGPLKLDEMIGEFRDWVESVEPEASSIETKWQSENAPNP